MRPIRQVANVATLPGIVEASYAMPDIHWGYGFPIGGVAATDVAAGGVVSPGGVGFDISCGVRLLVSQLGDRDIAPRLGALMDSLSRRIPRGMGKGAVWPLGSADELADLMRNGAAYAVAHGSGSDADLARCEDGGAMPGAEPDGVSERARSRGLLQVGSLGSGNHFLEVQAVDRIYDPAAGNTFGLFPGQICVMIHCGSRENKRNYRLWHSGVEPVECEGYRPVHPGGTGGAAQIWAGTNGADGGHRIIGGVFDNEDATYPIVENLAPNPVRFEGTEIRVPNPSAVLTIGGGATYDDRTRVVYIKVRPVLKTADFSAATPVFVGGLRVLDGNYAGPLIKVRRVDTGATVDIYPTSTGALDTAAIATFCGSAVGTIATIYDRQEQAATPRRQ